MLSIVTLGLIKLSVINYAECGYAVCHNVSVSILSVVLMNAIRLSVVTLNEDPLMPPRSVCQILKSDLSRTSNRDQNITMAFRNLITLC